MAINDVFLRPDAGDGVNGVRLRPDGPDAGGAAPFFVAALGVLSAVTVLALGSVFTPENIVIQSAAPPADTTVLRAPTYQQHKIPPPVFAFQQQNLLTSTLAGQVAAAPFVPVQWPGVQRYLSLPTDTSRGQTNADAQAPVGESAAWAPIALVRNVVDTTQKQPITLQTIVLPAPFTIAQWPGVQRYPSLPADTTRSTPKTLTADAQAPVGESPVWAPVALVRNVVDTSSTVIRAVAPPADTTVLRAATFNPQKVLPAVTVVQPPNLLTSTLAVQIAAPFVPAQWPGVQWYPSLPADTSRGQINADAQAPVGESAAWAPIALVRNVVDTTQKQPITLQVIVLPPPFVPAQWPGVQRYPSLPADTSRGQTNADAQAPVGASAAWAPVALVRNVVDTTQKQPIALQVIVPPAPISNLPNYGPVRFFWQPEDTSAGTAKTLTADAQLPFQNRFLDPQNKGAVWVVVNTARGTPVELFPVIIPGTEYAYTFIGV